MEALNPEEYKEYMKRMEESNAAQARYAKKQYHMSMITALASIIILAIVILGAVRLNALYADLQKTMRNIETVSSELAKADIDGMIKDVEGLVDSSQSGLNDAIQKIDLIDIETLNKAILDLSNVVDPLSQFFSQFKR